MHSRDLGVKLARFSEKELLGFYIDLSTNFRESFNNIWRKLKQGQIIEDFSKCSKNFREISLTALSESARIR